MCLDNPTFFKKIYYSLMGYPQLGSRIRARAILKMIRKNEWLLDAGCGKGVYSITLAKRGFKVIGMDITREDIKIGKSLSRKMCLENIDFVLGDLRAIPFKKGFSGTILCNAVLECVDNDLNVISELKRVSKPRSMLVVATNCLGINKFAGQKTFPYTFSGKNYSIFREGYSYQNLEKLLSSGDFTIKDYKYILKFFGVRIWAAHKKIKHGLISIAIFPFAYLVAKLDGILPNKNGYGLVVEAEKSSN